MSARAPHAASPAPEHRHARHSRGALSRAVSRGAARVVAWADANPRLTLLALYLVPLALAGLFMAESRSNPFFSFLVSDERYYLEWARDIVAGKGFGARPFFISPLYLFFLVPLTKLGLAAATPVRVVQVILGSLCWPLAYLLGRRLFGTRAGLLGALLLLGYGTMLFSLTDMAPPWLETLLVLLLALLLTRELSYGNLALAGLTGGVLALSRPTVLLFALLAPLFLLFVRWSLPGEGRSRRIAKAALFAAAFLLPILPVTLRNWVRGHDLVLISSHGGINFYIGNSPGSPGSMYAPPGLETGLMSLNDSGAREVAQAATGRAMRPSEVSRWWFRRGADFLVRQPAEAGALYARKLLLFLHATEVSTNADILLFRERSLVLRALRVPFPLLLLLAAAGIWLSRSDLRRLAPLHLLMLTQAVTPIVFFAAFRFRVPLAPLLAAFAGCALDRLPGLWKSHRRTVAGCGAAGLAALVVLVYPYRFIREMDFASRVAFTENLGVQLYTQGRRAEAEPWLRKAVQLHPEVRNAHYYLAELAESRGDVGSALEEWSMAVRLLGPNDPWGALAAARLEVLRRRATPGGGERP